MAKRKRKLTAAEKRARKRRREEFIIIFINGKKSVWSDRLRSMVCPLMNSSVATPIRSGSTKTRCGNR